MLKNRNSIFLCITLAISILAAGCSREDTSPAAAAKATVGTEIDDTVVTTKVKGELLRDPEIKSFDLKVETRKGAVQLSGFVESQVQVERAMAAARTVPGVLSVENAITLKTESVTIGNSVDDGIITAKVKAALLSDPAVKSADIAVVTRKNSVQLSGFVDNQAQIDMAISLAGKVEGVATVDNEMSIKK